MPDLEKIQKHLSALSEDINNLKKYSGITAADILKDIDKLWILERGIYLAVQNLFDMFAHIISADFNIVWESYSDVADILAAKDLINDDNKKLLIQMIGYRNRLSHDYLSLDPGILADIVNNKLDDINYFQKVVSDYCNL